MPLLDVFGTQWYHNSLRGWLTAALTASVLFLVLMLARRMLVSRVGALAERTTNHLDDMVVGVLRETRVWALGALSVYVATLGLVLPSIDRYLPTAAKLVLLWQGALWGGAAVSFWVQ
ncbi:MAG TPA: hypothetical protein VIP11_25150, partial [Gemmatimonadaceae bacterium]